MNSDAFLNNMLEVFDNEVDNLTLECEFKQLDVWDSLASVTTVAMIYAEYDIQVSGNELLACNSLAELMSVIQEKQAVAS